MIMLYKYETHMHTSQGSDCSSTGGAKMVERLAELGYTGCFVTDHFFGGNTAVDRSLPWDVRIHLYCQGYEDAKRRGDELGLQVFFGVEFAYRATEFLTYGIDKQFLLDHPELDRMELNAFAALVHENGGFVVHAHPFREADYISTIRLYPRCVDGVEIYNCGNRDQKFNDRARYYAESYGLPMTGGSDAHHWWCHPNGGIALDEKLSSPLDYLERLKSGRITKILERDGSVMLPEPENAWAAVIRPNIDLLPEELREKALKSKEQK